MVMIARLTGILLLLFSATFAHAQSLQNLSDADRAALRQEIRGYLLDNPEIFIEIIGLLEQKQAQAEEQAALTRVSENATAIFDDGFSYSGNNPNGDVTFVEFLDYRCPFCKRAHANIQALMKADPGIRYIIKEYPVLGPESELASRAAIAVLITQGDAPYKAFNNSVMRFNGPITIASLSRIAERLDIDMSPVLETMNTDEVSGRIFRTIALGEKLAISGTPTFVIGEEIIAGFITFDQMRDAVKAAREALN